jgi:hypothetical protein
MEIVLARKGLFIKKNSEPRPVTSPRNGLIGLGCGVMLCLGKLSQAKPAVISIYFVLLPIRLYLN